MKLLMIGAVVLNLLLVISPFAACSIFAADISVEKAADKAAESSDEFKAGLSDQAPPWYDRQRSTWSPVTVKGRSESNSSSSWFGGWGGWGGGGLVQVIAWTLLAAACVGLIAVIVRAAFSWRRDAVPAARTTVKPRAAAQLAAVPLPAGVTDIEAALQAARACGDYGACVILLYARHLLRMGDHGAVVLTPGTTDRAYVRAAWGWAGAATPRSPAAAALARMAQAFTAIRFGGQHATTALVAELDAADAQAAAALASGPPEADVRRKDVH